MSCGFSNTQIIDENVFFPTLLKLNTPSPPVFWRQTRTTYLPYLGPSPTPAPTPTPTPRPYMDFVIPDSIVNQPVGTPDPNWSVVESTNPTPPVPYPAVSTGNYLLTGKPSGTSPFLIYTYECSFDLSTFDITSVIIDFYAGAGFEWMTEFWLNDTLIWNGTQTRGGLTGTLTSNGATQLDVNLSTTGRYGSGGIQNPNFPASFLPGINRFRFKAGRFQFKLNSARARPL